MSAGGVGAVALPRGAWAAANHAALQRWLSGRRPRPAVAVFDFDNTCVFNDIGDAVFRHQLDSLKLRLPPEGLAGLLPTPRGAVQTLDAGLDLDGLVADIMEAYQTLWPHMVARNYDAVLGSAPHLDLRAKLGVLYPALMQTAGLGAPVAYPWLARLLHGFSDAEVEALSWAAWQRGVTEALGVQRWEAATAGRAGRLSFAFRSGLRLHPEMRDLMAAAGHAAVGVYVVTASAEGVVRGLVRRLGLPVPDERIFGMRPAAPDYPLTYRAGKVAVIERFLPGPPALVAGDADTDYEMLTHFEATEVRLVINRNKGGDIGRLYGDALRPTTRPLTLLQGRDENGGCFQPGRETTALGNAAPQPLVSGPDGAASVW